MKQIGKDIQSLTVRQLQHENQIIEEKKEKNSHFAILQQKLKLFKERDEYIRKHKKSHSSSSRSSESYPKEESLRINDYYQPTPKRTRRESQINETRVNLPYFYGKENVEVYINWEMKVEQLFACHRLIKERKLPLAILSFQSNAMFWWTAL